MTFLIDRLKELPRDIIFLIFMSCLTLFISSILCGCNLFEILINSDGMALPNAIDGRLSDGKVCKIF
jgi:hypothetical protein